jgi:hypothetical protein
VPSSISSSEPRRIPAGDWRGTWIVALTIAIATTAWCEHLSRARGQRPTVVDDPVYWSLFRRAVDDDPHVVAFVGTSRLQLAYSADAFRDAAPELHGIQLAINGVPAIGVLEDLAADERFHGIAVVDLDEWDIAHGDAYKSARPYVDRAHALWRAPGALAERWLAMRVQEHLAVLAVGGHSILVELLHGRWPSAGWVVVDRERVAHPNYQLATPDLLAVKARKRLSGFDEPTPSAAAWLASALAIDPLVEQIRAHGGDVVVVRLPVSGRLAELFEQHYPRKLYWDAFAARTEAHVMHFRDVAATRDLVCPDEMHLDQKDQATVTRSIVDELRSITRGPTSLRAHARRVREAVRLTD